MTTNLNTFTGEYSYTVDNKGRINIPAKFRKALSADNEEMFVITKGLDPCIWVYPAIVWKNIENNLKNLSSLSAINRTFIRNTVRYASSTSYDKQGRIQLTSNLIDYSHLKKKTLIIVHKEFLAKHSITSTFIRPPRRTKTALNNISLMADILLK